jgi:hypothetical protein
MSMETLSMTEAAARLGVSVVKIRGLVRDGVLPARPNPLDKREKLIPLSAVEQLAAEGRPAPRPKPRSAGIINNPSLQRTELEEETPQYPWPSTVGATDLGIQSDKVDEWLEANWHPA